MNAGVPPRGAVSPVCASPKSATRTRPSEPTSTLSGLKSPWTMPARCAAASALAHAANARTIAVAGLPASHARSVAPSTYSIAMNAFSPIVPTSWTATALGWRSRAIARASATSRSRAAAPPASVGRTTLIATSRSSRLSCAR